MLMLREYFETNSGYFISKWLHYFEIYERHLERCRGRGVHMLEMGVFHGGSLQLIDQVSAWHTGDAENFEVDDFSLSAHSMHYYDSVLVIEKRRQQPPTSRVTGRPAF